MTIFNSVYKAVEPYKYEYDFRGKTATDLTNEGWATISGTSTVSSSGLLIVGTACDVVKSFDFSNANKITLSSLFSIDGYAMWIGLNNISQATNINMDTRQNFRRLYVDNNYTEGSGASTGEKTANIVYDLINKTFVGSITGYQDLTMSLSDADVTLIRNMINVDLGCWSANSTSQNIVKKIELTIE